MAAPAPRPTRHVSGRPWRRPPNPATFRARPTPGNHHLIEAINTVEAAMKAEFGDVRWSFFEPDNAD